MDKKKERSKADKVLRRFAKEVKALGFIRTKPSFFTREKGAVIEFIHIHKYTFGPYFRMHFCFRVLNDPKEFISLSGLTEKELAEEGSFDFGEDLASVEQCAKNMGAFVLQYAEPWFTSFENADRLLSESSPLYEEEKAALKSAIAGGSVKANEQRSRAELGIA